MTGWFNSKLVANAFESECKFCFRMKIYSFFSAIEL
jgi:hypothetical protein